MKFYYILLTIIFISCKFDKENVIYYDNGDKKKILYDDYQFIEYFKTGSIKEMQFRKESNILKKNIDSLKTKHDLNNFTSTNTKYIYIEFYENGQLQRIGGYDGKFFKNGIWNYFNSNGDKVFSAEYQDIEGREYLNRIWEFNKLQDTINGNAYKLYLKKDTFAVNERILFRFYLTYPTFSYDSDLFVCVPKNKNNSSKIKDDFSNINEIEWDTIENFHSYFLNKKIEPSKYDNLRSNISFEYEKSGPKIIKGFIIEKDSSKKDSVNFRKYYFKKKLYITE